MSILGDLFGFTTRATLTEDQISDADSVTITKGLGLDTPGKYPVDTWSNQAEIYAAAYSYFTGEVLDTLAKTKTDDGEDSYLYPLKINLIQPIVFMLHAALLGEYDDDNVISWRARPRDDTEGAKTVADELGNFINQQFVQNDRDGLMVAQASTLQLYGGCIFRARYDPGAHTDTGIIIEGIPPSEFYPVPDSVNPHRILEYFFVRSINRREAELMYGVTLKDDGSQTAIYQEHWTEREYEVTVEGEQALSPYTGDPMKGPNPFVDPLTGRPFLPVEYIPAWRAPISDFYGVCPVDCLTGLQDEINLQMANIGDTVAQNAHRQMWIKGMAQAPDRLRLDPNTILNLGIGVPNHTDPELGVVEAPSIPSGTADFVSSLVGMIRNLSFTPPVVWGEDEGSQRSALTLAFRMYQLIAKTRTSRVFLTSGFSSFAEKLAMMAISKGLSGIGEQHLRHEVLTEFAPSMPQDRLEMIDEISKLAAAKMISPESAVELRGVPDQDKEVELLKEYQEWQTKMMAEAQPSPFGPGGRNPNDSQANKPRQ